MSSSFKSYFGKKHTYNTQADLKDMTPEQIVNLNPKEISSDVETNTGGIPLTGVKRKAMLNLLAIKRQEKKTPSVKGRQNAIDNFLNREGLNKASEVTSLIVKTDNQLMRENLEQKDLENRLKKLNDQEPIPDTEEEAIFRRINRLGGKRRKNKTVYKKKSRKGRKNRKTYKRK